MPGKGAPQPQGPKEHTNIRILHIPWFLESPLSWEPECRILMSMSSLEPSDWPNLFLFFRRHCFYLPAEARLESVLTTKDLCTADWEALITCHYASGPTEIRTEGKALKLPQMSHHEPLQVPNNWRDDCLVHLACGLTGKRRVAALSNLEALMTTSPTTHLTHGLRA